MIAVEVAVPYVEPSETTYCHNDEWSPYVVDNFDDANADWGCYDPNLDGNPDHSYDS
jgi:hypothetical protein